jgi:hypothetical protein
MGPVGHVQIDTAPRPRDRAHNDAELLGRGMNGAPRGRLGRAAGGATATAVHATRLDGDRAPYLPPLAQGQGHKKSVDDNSGRSGISESASGRCVGKRHYAGSARGTVCSPLQAGGAAHVHVVGGQNDDRPRG